MSINSLQDYFEALDRLVAGCPKIVAKGTRITNDSVSIEAGRGKGSIKKSRLVFSDLIEAIRVVAENQFQGKNEIQEKIDKAKKQTLSYKKMYEESIGRELSLIYEIDELKQTIRQLTNNKVSSISRKS